MKPQVIISRSPANLILVPSELNCPICPLAPPLSKPMLKNNNALLLCVEGFDNIEIFVKKCKDCGLEVSYKDYDLNIFNFNDNLVMSHRLLDRW